MSYVFFASMTGCILAGLFLGGWYFLGLWWTIRRIPVAVHPSQLYLLSLAVRLLVIAVAFYGVIKWFDWLHLLALLAAFLVARRLVIAYLVKSDAPEAWSVKSFF